MKDSMLAAASMLFLNARQQAITLKPVHSTSLSGYVWRKIFLKGGKRRAF